MTAAHRADDTNNVPAEKHAAKHAATKGYRFHPIARVHDAAATVTAPLTKSGRAARALRKGVEGENVTPIRPVIIPAADTPTFTYRKHVEVGNDGVGTPIYQSVAAGFGSFAHETSETIGQAFETNWVVQLFESPEQRKNRVNAQAVVGVLQLAGSAALWIAKRAK